MNATAAGPAIGSRISRSLATLGLLIAVSAGSAAISVADRARRCQPDAGFRGQHTLRPSLHNWLYATAPPLQGVI